MTASCVYLWILRSFSDHLFYRAPMVNYLFHLQVAEFQPSHTVNKYFTCALYTRRRISYSKAFMYLKSLKIILKKLVYNRLQDANQQVNKKKSFTHSPSYILPSQNFLRIHTNTFWKFASTTSFRKYKWKVVIYLFDYDSSKSFFFMLNMAFDVLLCIVSCSIIITRTSSFVLW